MSGSDAGVMSSSRDGFGHQNTSSSPVNLLLPSHSHSHSHSHPHPHPHSHPQQHSVVQSMRLSFSSDGTPVYKPVPAPSPTTYQPSAAAAASVPGDVGLNMNMSGGGGGGDGDSLKRKRGRPRKYGPDGSMSLALSPVISQSPPSTFSPPTSAATARPTPTSAAPSSPNSFKKSRGRPPGSGKKHHIEPLGSVGVGFVPHVITVKAGEDVSSKIMSFSQHGPRAVCILSASGAISNVTLRQPATSGGTVTYEGRFEILSLSGSFMLNQNGGQRSRTGGLSVSLSGSDGRVLGGGVAGILTAATPVQVIVGSFVADGRKESKEMEDQKAPSMAGQGGGTTGGSSPTSRSESSGGGSPLNQSTGGCNNIHSSQGMSNMHWK